MGEPAEAATYCLRIDGLLKLEASRENAFVLSGEIQRSEMAREGSVLRPHPRRHCCVDGLLPERSFSSYVSVDLTVHHPPPLWRCFTAVASWGKIYICKQLCWHV